MTSILNIGHFFEYEAAQAAARAALERLPRFSAVSRITLGIRHKIKDWIVSGFEELTTIPFPAISHLEAQRLEIDTFYLIFHTRNHIEIHRRSIAYCAPPMQHIGSCTSVMCSVGWQVEWRDKVSQYLMHPDAALRGRAILQLLENTQIDEVSTDCLQHMITLIHTMGILTLEDMIIENALRTLVGSF